MSCGWAIQGQDLSGHLQPCHLTLVQHSAALCDVTNSSHGLFLRLSLADMHVFPF